jgi:hypothetical protein
MLQLLEDIAVDAEEPVDEDNPLRQVIINTHSPVVVEQVPDSSLLIAELKETVRDGERFKHVSFSWLPDTWRADAEPQTHPVARGKVLAYLKHVIDFKGQSSSTTYQTTTKKSVKVGERRDLHPQFSINEP